MARDDPERSWHWRVESDPRQYGWRSDKTVDLGRNGLRYTGDVNDPSWGGGYTIGFQTIAEFLEQGPLDEQLPPELVAEIRLYLLAHPRPVADVELVAAVADEGLVLERVDAELDGVWVTAGHPPAEDGTFFAGSVAPGRHVVGAAFRTRGAGPDLAYSADVRFTVAAGERVRIGFTVTGRTVTATTVSA